MIEKITKKQKDSQYAKAPIIEAICDFVVEMPDNFKFDIKKISASLKREYEEKQEINIQKLQVHAGNSESSLSSSKELLGHSFVSKNKKYILQIKKNGFTFSQLGEYENWKTFSTKAKLLWALYVKTFSPKKVTRVALRYINRIDIPQTEMINLEDYFETYPRVLKNNKSSISNFFMQVQIPQTKEGGFAVLNQAVTSPISIGYVSIILDIDVFDIKEFTPASKSLWQRVDNLREQKNNLFEESITDKTKELFL